MPINPIRNTKGRMPLQDPRPLVELRIDRNVMNQSLEVVWDLRLCEQRYHIADKVTKREQREETKRALTDRLAAYARMNIDAIIPEFILAAVGDDLETAIRHASNDCSTQNKTDPRVRGVGDRGSVRVTATMTKGSFREGFRIWSAQIEMALGGSNTSYSIVCECFLDRHERPHLPNDVQDKAFRSLAAQYALGMSKHFQLRAEELTKTKMWPS